jgi:hypothetical protein
MERRILLFLSIPPLFPPFLCRIIKARTQRKSKKKVRFSERVNLLNEDEEEEEEEEEGSDEPGAPLHALNRHKEVSILFSHSPFLSFPRLCPSFFLTHLSQGGYISLHPAPSTPDSPLIRRPRPPRPSAARSRCEGELAWPTPASLSFSLLLFISPSPYHLFSLLTNFIAGRRHLITPRPLLPTPPRSAAPPRPRPQHRSAARSRCW